MASPEENSILLARIDERTKSLVKKIDELEDDVKCLKKNMREQFDKMNTDVASQYITKDTFLPVQRAMFAAISTLVGTVLVAAINFAFRQ